MCNPASRSRARAGPASFADRPPPAAGFTIAKKRSIETLYISRPTRPTDRTSQRFHNGGAVKFREALRQDISFYLQRCRERKVVFKDDDAVNAFVVQQSSIQKRNRFFQLVVEHLPV